MEPLSVKVTAPEDTIVSRIGVSLGVRMPPLPAEKNVELAPEMVNVVAVEETMTSSLTEPLMLALSEGDALGEITPSEPVEKTLVKPSMTVTLPAPPSEGAGVGVTMPSVPVDAWTAVEKKVVSPASPPVVEAGTKVAPPAPPPPRMVVVLSPEMIVVKPLPMIVVTTTEVIVEP